MRQVRTSIDRGLGGVRTVARGATASLAGVGAALSVREVVRYGDAWRNTQAQLRIVTEGTGQLAQVTEELLRLGTRTRSEFDATANLYARLARSTSELGISQRELLDVTETINQAIQVSGATSTEASNGLIQFSQGLAAGALRGDELRSVLEQMPRLARAIADGLDVPIGKLREMGKEGELTAEAVIGALQGQADVIAEEFAKLEPTIGSAFTVLNNNVGEFIGKLGEVSGATSGGADAILSLGEGVGQLTDAIQGTLRPADDASFAVQSIATAGIVAGRSLETLGRFIINTVITPFQILGKTIGAVALALTQLNRGELKGALQSLKFLGEDIAFTFRGIDDGLREMRVKAADDIEAIVKIWDLAARDAGPSQRSLLTGGSEGSGEVAPSIDFEAFVRANDERVKSIREGFEDSSDALSAFIRATREVETPLETFKRRIQEITFEAQKFGFPDDLVKRQIFRVQEDYVTALDGMRAETDGFADGVTQVFQKLSDEMTDAIVDFVSGAEVSFGDLVNTILRDIARITIREGITEKLSGFVSGATKSIFGGTRAGGGQVLAGRSYIVGEAGPELFTPGIDGNISPNLGGSVDVTVINNTPAQVDVQDQGVVGGKRRVAFVIEESIAGSVAQGRMAPLGLKPGLAGR